MVIHPYLCAYMTSKALSLVFSILLWHMQERARHCICCRLYPRLDILLAITLKKNMTNFLVQILVECILETQNCVQLT